MEEEEVGEVEYTGDEYDVTDIVVEENDDQAMINILRKYKKHKISYKTNTTFLIENLNILLADQSLVSVSGKIDQDILSEKHKLDFFANFSILIVSDRQVLIIGENNDWSTGYYLTQNQMTHLVVNQWHV